MPKYGHVHRAAMLHFSCTHACCIRGLHDDLAVQISHDAFLHGLAKWMWGVQQHILLSSCLFVLLLLLIPILVLHLCVSFSLPLGLSLNLLPVCPICIPLSFFVFLFLLFRFCFSCSFLSPLPASCSFSPAVAVSLYRSLPLSICFCLAFSCLAPLPCLCLCSRLFQCAYAWAAGFMLQRACAEAGRTVQRLALVIIRIGQRRKECKMGDRMS